MRRVFGVAMFGIAFTVLVGGGVGADDAKKLRDMVRQYLEGETRKAFDDGKKMFFEEARKRHPQGFSVQDENNAVEGLKMIFYNKAYIYYSCIISIGGTPAVDQQRAIADCVKDPIEEMAASLKLVGDYSALILGNSKAATCELKARRFKEEVEFPAYDFLAGSRLFDHKAMRACLTASVN